MKNICNVPFTEIEIHGTGDIYVCCPSKINLSLGNIYKEDFDKIWYSDKAKELRNKILQGNYEYCDLQICNPYQNIEQDKLELIDNFEIQHSETPDYPVYVKFCHDNHCNLRCITCRDDFCTNSGERNKELDEKIESIYLPILKNCKVVSLNGLGEAFASPHCKKLIKAIVKNYPNIKFDIHTNGNLCNKKVCDELGITEKLVSIDISMHAYTKETYQKIMIGSNYDRVIDNIKWLKTLKEKGSLKRLDLYFVVQKMNYKEMADFVKFAESVNANAYFWEYRNWGNKWGIKNYDKVAIYEKWHPEYNKFAKFLQNEIFSNDNCHLNNYLKTIKPISPMQHTKLILEHCLHKERFSIRINRNQENRKRVEIKLWNLRLSFKL